MKTANDFSKIVEEFENSHNFEIIRSQVDNIIKQYELYVPDSEKYEHTYAGRVYQMY